MRGFTIMVDSSCDLPDNYISEHGIEVMPMPFELDGKAHNQGYWQEISASAYYGALKNGGVAKTSQITPEHFVTVFTEYASQGKELLLLLLSSGLSNTCIGAQTALREVKEAYPGCNIHPLDTLNASSGGGLLAMLAVQKRSEGLSLGETAAWLEEQKHSCISLFTVDDLMYLHRGGRLSRFSAIAGSVLGVKPVLNVAPDGTLKLKEKVRGRKAALKLMVDHLVRSVGSETILDTVMINHTDCLEDANTLAGIIEAAVNVRRVVIMMMGPVIGAHVGPGAITLIFEADMTRCEYEKEFYGKPD